MPVRRITEAVIAKLAPTDKPLVIYDDRLKGFGVRLMPSGCPSYIVEYRPRDSGRRGNKRRMTIGSTTTLRVEEARKEARSLLASVEKGGDPARERTAARSALTVGELSERFLDHIR